MNIMIETIEERDIETEPKNIKKENLGKKKGLPNFQVYEETKKLELQRTKKEKVIGFWIS